MRRVLVGLSTGLLTVSVVAGVNEASASAAPAASGGATQSVIVVFRDQFTSLPATRANVHSRISAVDRSQSGVVAALARSGAERVRPLHLLNAVAATVTSSEADALRANPSVAEVVPNATITMPKQARPTARHATTAAPAPGVCPAKGKVQLNPEGVEAVHAVSDDPAAHTARRLGFDGAGVTVGDLAVGINPSALELTRPNGQPVIADYQDFTGEGTAPQGGEDLESYLDDSVIAAQGRKVYDLHDYTGGAVPAGCDIRLQGVSPGVSLDAYKIYGNEDQTTTSAFLEGIDYAVDTDHVNVLNEEGGSFPMPDTSADLIKKANSAAMAAGVTITSPSYDAGLESTIWSPSTQPGVISTGASTTFRVYAQDDIGEYSKLHARGWVSDNISSLSSGGSTEQARSIDVVAPGDLDWVLCSGDVPACGSGAYSDLAVEGGTSESGPIVAGVAALVYQAYRKTHGGANPSAALVRNIISSTADDLHSPAAQQGSGLVDAYRAVRAAMTAGKPAGGHGSPSLVANTQQLSAEGRGGASFSRTVTLHNEGTGTAHLRAAARTLGPASVLQNRTVHFTKRSGDQVVHFTLHHAVDRLTADLAYPGGDDPNPLSVSLVRPDGKLVAYSLPQGTGNHGHVDVHDAPAGLWTLDVSNAYGPYTGPASVQIATANMRSYGHVSASRTSIPAGGSVTITLRGTLPSHPGDQSASLLFSAAGSGLSTLPVTTRTLVSMSGGAGSFVADVVGGNGRGYVPAQTFFYDVDIAAHQPSLDVQTKLADDAKDPYCSFLIDPAGNAEAQACNQLVVGENANGPVTVAGPGAQLHTLHPSAGRWTIIVTFANPVTGDRQHTSLIGRVSTHPMTVTTHGLPNSSKTVLTGGSSYVARVAVHNSSSAPEAYFLDPRLAQAADLAVPPLTTPSTLTLPLSISDPYVQYVLPTHTTRVVGTATGDHPVTFDMQPFNGEPDVGATRSGNTATATVTGHPLTQGDWALTPNLVGPFTGAAPKTKVQLSMLAHTLAFDGDVATNTGDLWNPAADPTDFHPVIVQPGQSTTLYATITPTAGKQARVVRGTLYLDESSALDLYGPSPSGNDLVALPYEYTVPKSN